MYCTRRAYQHIALSREGLGGPRAIRSHTAATCRRYRDIVARICHDGTIVGVAAIKYIETKAGVRVFPVTHLRAVRDNAGNNLEALLNAVAPEQYVVLTAIADRPTASASTLGKIYLVPDNGEYDRYVTSYDGSTYSWVSLGTTAIDLPDYIGKDDGLVLGEIVETL